VTAEPIAKGTVHRVPKAANGRDGGHECAAHRAQQTHGDAAAIGRGRAEAADVHRISRARQTTTWHPPKQQKLRAQSSSIHLPLIVAHRSRRKPPCDCRTPLSPGPATARSGPPQSPMGPSRGGHPPRAEHRVALATAAGTRRPAEKSRADPAIGATWLRETQAPGRVGPAMARDRRPGEGAEDAGALRGQRSDS
jgi:hypothetical protein